MGYCTSAQLQAALSALAQAQLTADSGTSIDSTILTEVIDQASAKIDLYLCARYAVPVTVGDSALAYLREACVNIAAYKLLKRRLITGRNEDFLADYNQTLKELEEIKNGGLSLPGVDVTSDDDPGDVLDFSNVGSERQVYGRAQDDVNGFAGTMI